MKALKNIPDSIKPQDLRIDSFSNASPDHTTREASYRCKITHLPTGTASEWKATRNQAMKNLIDTLRHTEVLRDVLAKCVGVPATFLNEHKGE